MMANMVRGPFVCEHTYTFKPCRVCVMDTTKQNQQNTTLAFYSYGRMKQMFETNIPLQPYDISLRSHRLQIKLNPAMCFVVVCKEERFAVQRLTKFCGCRYMMTDYDDHDDDNSCCKYM